MIELFYTTLNSIDLAQYQIFRVKVCDILQGWFENNKKNLFLVQSIKIRSFTYSFEKDKKAAYVSKI